MSWLEILEISQTSEERHMSAKDVYRILLAEYIDIDLATVYHALTQFEQAGLLLCNSFESGKAIYELSEDKHHDRLVCLDRDRVEEFSDAEIEQRQQSIACVHGFALQEHALSLYGNCVKEICPHRPRRQSVATKRKRPHRLQPLFIGAARGQMSSEQSRLTLLFCVALVILFGLTVPIRLHKRMSQCAGRSPDASSHHLLEELTCPHRHWVRVAAVVPQH